MDYLIVWAIASFIVAVVADARGRSGLAWFLLSLVLSPLLAGILVIVLGRPVADDSPTPETHVKCPDCRELVLHDARKCKHCGAALVPQ